VATKTQPRANNFSFFQIYFHLFHKIFRKTDSPIQKYFLNLVSCVLLCEVITKKEVLVVLGVPWVLWVGSDWSLGFL